MNDHIHKKHEWMVSYTFMTQNYSGNMMGDSKVADDALFKTYTAVPGKMGMDMHMFMVMYGITDRLTLMGMGGFSTCAMSMNMDPGMPMPGMNMPMGTMQMQMDASGMTDTRLSALYNFSKKSYQRLVGSLGVGIPTGTAEGTGTTMLGDNTRMPYGMQIGSGSFELLPELTYVRNIMKYSFGGTAGGDIRLNYNPVGYKLGNNGHVGVWGARKMASFMSLSLHTDVTHNGAISGADPAQQQLVEVKSDPTVFASNSGGTIVSSYLGANFQVSRRYWSKFRLLVEYGVPVYQKLNGCQSAEKNILNATLHYSIH